MMLRLALLCLVASSAVQAQTADSVAYVRVSAGVSAAAGRVVVGGVDAGAPGDVLPVAAGRAVEVALVEAGAVWNPRRAQVGVLVPAGDTLAIGLSLPVRVRVETLPLRAQVALEAPGEAPRALGEAPVTLDVPAGTAGTLVARLDGYREARMALGAASPVTLVLVPEAGGAEGTLPATVLTTERRTGRRRLVDAGIGALTLAAGVVAVATKFRADDVDNRYRDPASAERGSPDLRAEASRLDRVALVALGAMQVGVGVLAVRFILR